MKKADSHGVEFSRECCKETGIGRRDFVRFLSISGAALANAGNASAEPIGWKASPQDWDADWPTFRQYGQEKLARIALPLGGIGTGTISLGGRGDLRDWEVMNRPAKGFTPVKDFVNPFFAIRCQSGREKPITRVAEGPIETCDYEGSHGAPQLGTNLPRFRNCSFDTAYPFARVTLSDPGVPLLVFIKAFNPFIPGDPDSSGIPIAVLSYELRNTTQRSIRASICGNLLNFIGIDGWKISRDWKGDIEATGAKQNRNEYREDPGIKGIFLTSKGVDPKSEQWGSLALATTAEKGVSYRTAWVKQRWGTALLDFWDDFSRSGQVEERGPETDDKPMASLAVELEIPAKESREVSFMISWHFPNRYSWTPGGEEPGSEDWIGNYYASQYEDSWEVVKKTVPRLEKLREKTTLFVNGFLQSSLPDMVKEAALFNLSTLRTQTCFRTSDGHFFGWEGCGNNQGCCRGSCTHVWNYEQATSFLFGELALSMREVEFSHATADNGLMSFRVSLPLERAQSYGKAAADGQMGCIMKMYRDWQLSGNDLLLERLWPKVRKALEFCWIPGGWDADRDGVMEGCQHNTMDVEYYGPNPQMGIWYLGALRAAEKMAIHLGDKDFAQECRRLFDRGSRWIDQNLFNGEYYEHEIRSPSGNAEIAPGLTIGMGAKDRIEPDYQLGKGCLVDQLVGQFLAHVCDLGYLIDPGHVRTTLQSIMKYNHRSSLSGHFNCLRTFALGDESALLMASYPKGRPKNPFPYFTEVMTGFEYTAAVGMLYEGQLEEGLQCIKNIRNRYDGWKRNPFDEAECGHHYARAMASWAAVLALSGFAYSGVAGSMKFSPETGSHFWSNGYAWGLCDLKKKANGIEIKLTVHSDKLDLSLFELREFGSHKFEPARLIKAGETIVFTVLQS